MSGYGPRVLVNGYARPLYFTGTVQLINGSGLVVGFALKDNGAGACNFSLYDGFGTGGFVIAAATVASTNGITGDFSACPRAFTQGLYVECTDPSRGTVWVI